MKKYSKGKLKMKRAIWILIVFFILLLILGLILLFAFCLKDNIEVEKQNNSAINISDEQAQYSSPIIIDNLVIGALYESKWVSASKYYLKSNNKSDLDINIYSKDIKAGTYKVRDVYSSEDSVYVNTSYPNYIDEYFALPSTDNYALTSQFSEAEIEEKDYEDVKKALGIYRVYNSSINIRNVYEGYINIDTPIRIISVTSSKKGIFGGIYSAVVVNFLNNNKSKIIEYSYTKDLENSDDFPLHSVEFLADLNGDGNCELVTRAVTEFNVTYNVFDYIKGNYYKVLSETMKGK